MTGVVLVCDGRLLDRDGQPVGGRCGRTYRPGHVLVRYADGRFPGWGTRPATVEEAVVRARAAGWSVGERAGRLAVMCPRCRKPDPELTAMLRNLHRPADDPDQEGLPL